MENTDPKAGLWASNFKKIFLLLLGAGIVRMGMEGKPCRKRLNPKKLFYSV